MQTPSVSSLLDFSGKVLVVTGSGRGIGAGIAVRFAEAGADLVVHYRTSEKGARKTLERIHAMKRKAIMFEAVLSGETGAHALVKQAVSAYGRIDVLVNNAGTYSVRALMETSLSDWQTVINANLTSAFLCTQAAAGLMISQGSGGAFINISSIKAQNPIPLHAHYAAAKAALDQFSRTAANELAQHAVRVNIVSPGLIWSENLEENWPDGVERWMKAVPLKRFGMPQDVADACLFLASPAARWVTGVNIPVDGGMLTAQLY